MVHCQRNKAYLWKSQTIQSSEYPIYSRRLHGPPASVIWPMMYSINVVESKWLVLECQFENERRQRDNTSIQQSNFLEFSSIKFSNAENSRKFDL